MKQCALCGEQEQACLSGDFISASDGRYELCSLCATNLKTLQEVAVVKNSAMQDAYETLRAYFSQQLTQNTNIAPALKATLADTLVNCDVQHLQTQELLAECDASSALMQCAAELLVTTGYTLQGCCITKYLDVLSGETCLGTGFLSEFSASFADLIGEESTHFSQKMSQARATSMQKLKLAAAKLNADAIIGIQFSYISFTQNMIGVVASGTAVRIQKETAQ